MRILSEDSSTAEALAESLPLKGFAVEGQRMLPVNCEAPDGSRRHNRLWNSGNGWGTVKLYDKTDGGLVLTDEVEATHIGCEYGEYDPQ